VRRELRVVLGDAFHRIAQRTGDAGPRPFGVRADLALTTAEPVRAGELVDEVLAIRLRQSDAVAVSLMAANPNPVSPAAYDRQAQAYLHFDVVDRLGGITAPTLVTVGEQDLLTPPWIAREVAGGIPGARFQVVTGSGSSHALPLERADDFNRAVMDFLAG
jgi:pimeloyl-ACP methyl ester carboxylesterase